MTCDSELFVSEELRDAIYEEIENEDIAVKPKDIEIVVPDEWCDIWDSKDYPDYGEAKIVDAKTMQQVGLVKWCMRFEVGDNGYGKFVEGTLDYIEELVLDKDIVYSDKEFY